MAYIHTIDPGDADETLTRAYTRFANSDGSVDDVLRVHSLNPASLNAHCSLYVQAMHGASPVSRAEREMVGVTVSRLNGCRYCLEHHSRGLARLLPDDRKQLAEALKQGDMDGLSQREQAMCQYAAKLTLRPASITQADIDDLARAGLSDREILDVAQAAAYFAYANRIVLGLGASLDADHSIGQWPDAKSID